MSSSTISPVVSITAGRGRRSAVAIRSFAKVDDTGGVLSIILLKESTDNNTNAISFETGSTNNLYANDNAISPNLRNIKVPISYNTLKNNIQFENVPLGLTPHFNAIDTKHIEIVLKGKANAHNISDSIDDMKVTLDSDIIQGALFVKPVEGLEVDFIEKRAINYRFNFSEIYNPTDTPPDGGKIGTPAVVNLHERFNATLLGLSTNPAGFATEAKKMDTRCQSTRWLRCEFMNTPRLPKCVSY